jgi:hypothetical protein
MRSTGSNFYEGWRFVNVHLFGYYAFSYRLFLIFAPFPNLLWFRIFRGRPLPTFLVASISLVPVIVDRYLVISIGGFDARFPYDINIVTASLALACVGAIFVTHACWACVLFKQRRLTVLKAFRILLICICVTVSVLASTLWIVSIFRLDDVEFQKSDGDRVEIGNLGGHFVYAVYGLEHPHEPFPFFWHTEAFDGLYLRIPPGSMWQRIVTPFGIRWLTDVPTGYPNQPLHNFLSIGYWFVLLIFLPLPLIVLLRSKSAIAQAIKRGVICGGSFFLLLSICYFWYSSHYSDREVFLRLRKPVWAHIDSIKAEILSDPRFANIEFGIEDSEGERPQRYHVALAVNGKVKTGGDLEELKRTIEATHPTVGVVYGVKVLTSSSGGGLISK